MPILHHAIDVTASGESCWRALVDLSTWTEWFPLLQSVRASGGESFRVGGRLHLVFSVGALRIPLTVTVEEFAPPHKVRWVGGNFGVRGNHAFTVEERAPGTMRFTSHEEFSGLAARLLTGPIFSRIDGEVYRSMERFKALVERAG